MNDHNLAYIYLFKFQKEGLAKVCNMLKVNNEGTKAMLFDVILVSLWLILNIFCIFSAYLFAGSLLEWIWTLKMKTVENWKLMFSCQLHFPFLNFKKVSILFTNISCTFFSGKLIFQNLRYTFWFFADMPCLSAFSHSHNFMGCNSHS